PHSLHTRCASFASPQFGHSTIPGIESLMCERRLFLRVFEVLLFGTAIILPPQCSALKLLIFLVSDRQLVFHCLLPIPLLLSNHLCLMTRVVHHSQYKLSVS